MGSVPGWINRIKFSALLHKTSEPQLDKYREIEKKM